MAFVSDATIIVEAPEKSGTIQQAGEAIRRRRRLFLMAPLFETGEGPWREVLSDVAIVLTRNSFLETMKEFVGRTG